MKKNKKFDAIDLKSKLQNAAGEKIAHLSTSEQLALLKSKYGHLTRKQNSRQVD